jgi:hypothetical protein
MKKTFLFFTLILMLSACGSKSDSELLIGTWKEIEFIYLSDLTPVLPYDEFGYETSINTYDGKNCSGHSIWYGSPSETYTSTYTMDEATKKLTTNSEYGEIVYDYNFPDENTLVLTYSMDNKMRKATYNRQNQGE